MNKPTFNSLNDGQIKNNSNSKKDFINQKKVKIQPAIIKKSLFDKDTILGSIVYDIIIPAFKNIINDSIRGGLDRLLFNGETRPGSSSHKNYNSISSGTRIRTVNDGPPVRSGFTHNFDHIKFNTLEEANEVVMIMRDCIDQHQQVSVGDFFELAGVPVTYSDYSHGWTRLGDTRVYPTRDGYVINLPRPIALII